MTLAMPRTSYTALASWPTLRRQWTGWTKRTESGKDPARSSISLTMMRLEKEPVTRMNVQRRGRVNMRLRQ